MTYNSPRCGSTFLRPKQNRLVVTIVFLLTFAASSTQAVSSISRSTIQSLALIMTDPSRSPLARRKRNISLGEAKELAPTMTTTTTTTSLRAGSVVGIPGEDGASKDHNHHRSSDSRTLLSWKRVRETVFPIYGHEVTKFLLIGSIKFFIIAALVLTRDTKDTLVVTQCGAEAIAFLKIYGVLPAATAYIALYSKLSNLFGKKALFYVTCIPFFVFFAVFDLLIYPNAAMLHPSLDTVQKLLGVVPGSSGGLTIFANILANWTSALFYILAEIYSSVSVGLLFWQFANDVVPVDQAKRFYPLFAQMSGLAPVVAGQYVVRYTSQADNFQTSMHRLTAAITLSGVMICIFYKTCTAYIERTEGKKLAESQPSSGKKKKVKPSMMESAKFLASSQYLRLIATLVLGYGLSINFTEIMWKSLVKRQYPNALDYQRFMGNFSTVVGAATCIVIFFGVHVIRILGWRVGAMATPGIMSLIAIPFFASILMGLDSPARLQTAVICGTILSLVSKTAKYALFDPTTQMSYIPLDDESKVKGKAAIDVLGSRIGKSGGSLIQQGLVILFGNIIQAAPVVSVIYYGVLLTWLGAANKLSGLFHAQTEMGKAEQHDEQQQQQHLKEK